ncbi:MAG: hypothetical protein L3J57_10190 [Desulfuromusa sp.]|nr:hypothetical protein [Desulfuromusa sp.]
MTIFIDPSRLKFLWMTVIIAVLFLAGCAPAGQNPPAQNSSTGTMLGKILTDVAAAALETQADQALGKNRGKIDRIQLLQENNSGYLLLVSYSDVKLPQGVTIVADAYGAEGKLTQYSSTPVPINQKQGQVQLALYSQGNSWSQKKVTVTNIFVKMIRDNNQNSWIAASSYLPGGKFQSAAGTPTPPPSAPPASTPAPTPATTDQAFCSQYADTAAQQFHLAQQHNCPGIAFPVWHDNKMLHYNWCLGVSRQTVNNEMTRRNNHLKTCGSN